MNSPTGKRRDVARGRSGRGEAPGREECQGRPSAAKEFAQAGNYPHLQDERRRPYPRASRPGSRQAPSLGLSASRSGLRPGRGPLTTRAPSRRRTQHIASARARRTGGDSPPTGTRQAGSATGRSHRGGPRRLVPPRHRSRGLRRPTPPQQRTVTETETQRQSHSGDGHAACGHGPVWAWSAPGDRRWRGGRTAPSARRTPRSSR